jgi:cytochrome P450
LSSRQYLDILTRMEQGQMNISAQIPRFVDVARFRADPLAFLRDAERQFDGMVVVSEDGAIFSRAKQCCGAVAIFGSEAIRPVLNDLEVFGMPVSVAKKLSLPERLVRLNKGLFSMHGDEHRRHQQRLAPLLSMKRARLHGRAIVEGWENFREKLSCGNDVPLLNEMRRLVLHVSARVLLGEDTLETGQLIQSYFDQRRKLSGSDGRISLIERRELIRTGLSIDRRLRARLAELDPENEESADRNPCVLAQLSRPDSEDSLQLTDEELIAHGNVLFMSSSEPVAVTLTWALLLLSQREDLRRTIGKELSDAFGDAEIPASFSASELPLLDCLIQETLRVLPPNAIMVRLTTTPARILGNQLPANCEVIISPYVAHRDAKQYSEPDRFDPARWRNLKPPAYSYFPFGTGGRYCLGQQLASFELLSLLARILSRYTVVLAHDQRLDWKMDITLMPSSDPIVRFLPGTTARGSQVGGRLSGPVATLVQI